MKANVRFTKLQGRTDDKKFHSVSEFCRIVANDVNLDVYNYFVSFYAAFIADTNKETKHTTESNDDFVKRVMNKAFNAAKNTPTSQLKETDLYKIFSSKNQLFKLIRTISPAFYDDDFKHQFAAKKMIAQNTAKISSEKVKDLEKSGAKRFTLKVQTGVIESVTGVKEPAYKVVELVTKDFKTIGGVYSESMTNRYYLDNFAKQRKQRKEKFADLKESSVFFFDSNDNVCTLVSKDQMNFSLMYAYVSEYAQRENFAKVDLQQQKEKKEKQQKETIKNNRKFDAAISKAFNALLEYRNKVAKKYSLQYISDDNNRNLVVAGFIKHTTEYKAACQKRFSNWCESDNEFLKDCAKVLHALTKEPAAANKDQKKKRSTKKDDVKAAETKKAA